MHKKTIDGKLSKRAQKKRKGAILNVIVFEKPTLGFWVSITNIISFYLSSILSVVQGRNNRNLDINNALRSYNAFKKTIDKFKEKIDIVLHEQLNEFVMEATIINKILSQYLDSKHAINDDDAQTLYAKVFKVQYLLSSLQKSLKHFIQKSK